MYHSRFKGDPYQAGYTWGKRVYDNGIRITKKHQLHITEERIAFVKECLPLYQKYYPEILAEIEGIASGQKTDFETLSTFLLSMYCFTFDNRCTCFACSDAQGSFLARNSDFLVSLEKWYDSCYYRLDNNYAFIGNTTAFVEMEDGINEHGLAVGFTFVYPKAKAPGINAGMLVRYLLEKCKTTKEAITALQSLPIASGQTFAIIDRDGDKAVIECNHEKFVIIRPSNHDFVVATNTYHTKEMLSYNKADIDDWKSEERYQVVNTVLSNTIQYPISLAKEILAGKHGFMCQYDRTLNADTVWSTIYDVTNLKVYRVEGNPSRKVFKEDTRMKFKR